MKRKVLVVDDEPVVADTLALILKKNGFECRVTYFGADAIAAAEDFCPDLLVCDISMPDIDGLDIASSITQTCPQCRALLMTGHYFNLKAAREWTRNHSVRSRILTKPLPPSLFLAEAETLMAD